MRHRSHSVSHQNKLEAMGSTCWRRAELSWPCSGAFLGKACATLWACPYLSVGNTGSWTELGEVNPLCWMLWMLLITTLSSLLLQWLLPLREVSSAVAPHSTIASSWMRKQDWRLHKITWNSLGKAQSWCRQKKSPIVSFLFSLCSRNSLLQDELGREGLFLWTMDTRASFITTMQETQNLSPEKGQSPANGDQEQFDSGELSFTITGYLHGHSPPADYQ